MVKVGLNGMIMFRCFGGLNFFIIFYIMCVEIVVVVDVGFGNIWFL